MPLSDDRVVVETYGKASNATGVNGNQNDNSALHSGAAYVFTGLGLGTRVILTREGSADYLIRFHGAPEITYRVQRASNLAGPWDTIATITAPASGLIEYHDTTPPPGQAFYRTVQP